MQKVDYTKLEDFQILGASAIIFRKAFGANEFIIDELLLKNNIQTYEPDKWYSLIKDLELKYMILEELGENIMFEIGKSLANYMELPDHIDTLEKALASLTFAYHSFHAKNNQPLFNPKTQEITYGIGDYKYLLFGTNAAKLICDNPYPCSFDKGLAIGIARKFKTLATVEYEAGIKHRKDGASQSTYIIRW